MAKLRQNHSRNGKKPFAGMAVKVFSAFGVLALMFIMLFRYLNSNEIGSKQYQDNGRYYEEQAGDRDIDLASSSDMVPEGNQSEVIEHQYYTLGYNEKHEQPDWVTYRLTKESLQVPNVKRSDRFNVDPEVSSNSAKHSDYTRSGYSRGHMVPAGDMAFNKTAMKETFFMSNMTPQITGFNGGIWRELEETVRDWAYENDELYVASGPIFSDVTEYIGKSSKVRVPSAFYKVIVDISGREKKGIGFIMPHEVSRHSIYDYAVSIDEVERETGFDFFDDLYNGSSVESKVESEYETSDWPISQKRFKNRVNNWNNN